MVALIYIALLKTKESNTIVMELDDSLVKPYWQATAEGDYERAYGLLTDNYRKDISLEDFITGHGKRRAEFGPILNAEIIRIKSSINIFTGRREHQVLYEIYYPNRTYRDYIMLKEEKKGEYFIEGTYRISAGNNLNYYLW